MKKKESENTSYLWMCAENEPTKKKNKMIDVNIRLDCEIAFYLLFDAHALFCSFFFFILPDPISFYRFFCLKFFINGLEMRLSTCLTKEWYEIQIVLSKWKEIEKRHAKNKENSKNKLIRNNGKFLHFVH